MSAAEGEGCRCGTCATIHAEFIDAFGKWPEGMSHEDGQAMQRQRDENEASWRRAEARFGGRRYGR